MRLVSRLSTGKSTPIPLSVWVLLDSLGGFPHHHSTWILSPFSDISAVRHFWHKILKAYLATFLQEWDSNRLINSSFRTWSVMITQHLVISTIRNSKHSLHHMLPHMPTLTRHFGLSTCEVINSGVVHSDTQVLTRATTHRETGFERRSWRSREEHASGVERSNQEADRGRKPRGAITNQGKQQEVRHTLHTLFQPEWKSTISPEDHLNI